MPQEFWDARRCSLSDSLRLLLDEIGVKAYEELKRANLDVQSVLMERRGIKDLEIISIAKLHNKIIVTMDKDFGHLALSQSSYYTRALLKASRSNLVWEHPFLIKGIP